MLRNAFTADKSGTSLVAYENVSFTKTQKVNIMQHFLGSARFAIEGFCMMLQDTEDEVSLQVTMYDSTPKPYLVSLWTAVLRQHVRCPLVQVSLVCDEYARIAGISPDAAC